MLLVKTKIGKSDIEGLGCFADQFIPKGGVVWKYNKIFDSIVSKEAVNQLPEIPKEKFLRYAYLNKKTGNYTLCGDDGRFFNHSKNPNVISMDTSDDDEGLDVAVRDIQKGEEITCNYDEFDDDAHKKLSLESK